MIPHPPLGSRSASWSATTCASGLLGFGGPVALVRPMESELVARSAAGSPRKRCGKASRSASRYRDRWPSRSASSHPICAAASGARGRAAGPSSCRTSSSSPALGALYVHFGGLPWVTAIFYGVSPAVIALILHSCYRLAKLGMEDWLQWADRRGAFVVTVAVQAEVALLFIGCRHPRHSLLRLTVPHADSASTTTCSCRPPAASRPAPARAGATARQALHVLPEGGLADLRQRARHRALSSRRALCSKPAGSTSASSSSPWRWA